jgi:hypothetical protein
MEAMDVMIAVKSGTPLTVLFIGAYKVRADLNGTSPVCPRKYIEVLMYEPKMWSVYT